MSYQHAADSIGFKRTYERVCNGFVTPTVVSEGKISGCVYRDDGTKVVMSERFGGWRGDLFRSENPGALARPACVERSGKGLYLGSLMAGHYGHFITEGLSTFWIFETFPAENFDYFLFSPFVFGSKFPDYALQCLRAFGIDPERIVITGEQAMAFEDLVVPERLFRLNHSVDPALAWVYCKITSQIDDLRKPLERVYLSRRKISLKQLTRVIANEALVEKLFLHAGFKVIYPEELSFRNQLALYANASVVAGASGSALHNSLFMRAGALLIELGDPRYDGERSPTQILCDHVSGVKSGLIPLVGKFRDGGKSISVDIENIRKQLLRILNDAGMSALNLENSLIRLSHSERLETIYLTYRPLIGARLKKLLRRI